MQEVKPVENVILAMLFTYPGAIAYMVYYISTKDKTYYHELDSFSRAACCFFLSAAATVTSFGFLSLKLGETNLEGIIKQIKTTPVLWIYLIVSFFSSIVLGTLWHYGRRIVFYFVNRYRKKNNLSPYGKNQRVWPNLMQNYPITDCAAVIRKKGRFVRAGMPQILPDDLGTDQRIVLSYCDRVEAELNKPDQGILGERYWSVYDLATDTEIEFIESSALDKQIYGEKARRKQ